MYRVSLVIPQLSLPYSIIVEFIFHAFFHHIFEVIVGLSLFMSEHEISSQMSRNTIDGQIRSLNPMVEIIILATPTIKDVGKSVDVLKQGRH